MRKRQSTSCFTGISEISRKKHHSNGSIRHDIGYSDIHKSIVHGSVHDSVAARVRKDSKSEWLTLGIQGRTDRRKGCE